MFATKYLVSEVCWALITKYFSTIPLSDKCWGKIPYRIREVLSSNNSVCIFYVLELHNLVGEVEELLVEMYEKVDIKMENYSMAFGRYFKYFFYKDRDSTLEGLDYTPIEESMKILALVERSYLDLELTFQGNE